MAQMKGTYLENYLESIATLPAEIRRNFALMRELDAHSQEIIDRVNKGTKEYVQNGKRGAKDLNGERSAKEMRTDLKKCLQYGDEKVALAVQTYELVDKHIRRLDTDLKRFEAELEQEEKKKQGGEKTPMKEKGKGRGKPDGEASPLVSLPSASVAPSPARKKGDTTLPADARVKAVDIDMPIDPNEPTYCICNRVSFGEMVGCDNADCKVEWFHFECVGLTNPPKGKWYCPDCNAIKKKQLYK